MIAMPIPVNQAIARLRLIMRHPIRSFEVEAASSFEERRQIDETPAIEDQAAESPICSLSSNAEMVCKDLSPVESYSPSKLRLATERLAASDTGFAVSLTTGVFLAVILCCAIYRFATSQTPALTLLAPAHIVNVHSPSAATAAAVRYDPDRYLGAHGSVLNDH